MGATLDLATGTTVTFGTSSFAAVLLSCNFNGVGREAVKTSTMTTTGYHTYIPTDIAEPGTLELEFVFDVDKYTTANTEEPWRQAAETVTLTFPIFTSGNSTAAKVAGSAFVTQWSVAFTLEEVMVATMTCQFSGTITFTDEAA